MLNSSPSRNLFFFSLILGTFIAVSSNSWFTAWLGLELNLLSFIPIISSSSNSYSSEAAVKYFLIQALGSLVILIGATFMTLLGTSPSIFILAALLLKMGAAPVHFWFPSIMQGISWTQCIILMTIQKIAPMALMSYTLINPLITPMIQISSGLSAVVGAIGGLNQTLLRKIMAYSSINHMSWMMAAVLISTDVWVSYIFIYSIVSSSAVLLLKINQIFHFKQMSLIQNTKLKAASFLCLFSLGGLPPFLGFTPKLLMITLLSSQQEIMWLLILLTSSLITLFYYTRITLSTLTMSSPKLKATTNINLKLTPYFMTFINFSPLLFPFLTFIQL